MNVKVTVPLLVLLRVGAAGATVDELLITATPSIPAVPTTPTNGNNTVVDWNGAAPTFTAGAAQNLTAYGWTNAVGGASVACAVTSAFPAASGLNAAAKGHATEIYAAFESAREKMDKQLRRYKRRIRNHHQTRPQPVEFGGASSYILAATEEPEEGDSAELTPIIIAEMETKIPSITVGEAVMQLELAGQRFLVFRNEGHGGVNVVYGRDDGNIGWIDPRNSK